MAYTAVQDLGKQLRNKRAVESLVKRFAKKIASDTSPLRVEILDIVQENTELEFVHMRDRVAGSDDI